MPYAKLLHLLVEQNWVYFIGGNAQVLHWEAGISFVSRGSWTHLHPPPARLFNVFCTFSGRLCNYWKQPADFCTRWYVNMSQIMVDVKWMAWACQWHRASQFHLVWSTSTEFEADAAQFFQCNSWKVGLSGQKNWEVLTTSKGIIVSKLSKCSYRLSIFLLLFFFDLVARKSLRMTSIQGWRCLLSLVDHGRGVTLNARWNLAGIMIQRGC